MKDNNMDCFRSFYRLRISPEKDGKAFLATCCNNMFRAQNHVIVDKGIKDAWNAPQFIFQRKSISNNDWSFCKGSSCFFYPYFDETQMLNRPLIKGAVSQAKAKLEYPPQVVNIIPSYSCNNNCYMCYHVSQNKKAEEYKLRDNLLKEIEEDIIPGAEYVTISGGEPFFSKRTREFIFRVMSANPGKKLMVNTNGLLLREYGLENILASNIHLNVSVYGMKDETYEAVTRSRHCGLIFDNVAKLIDLGYQNMHLIFIVTSKNYNDGDDFCWFIEQNKNIKGMVRNNCFESDKYWKLMAGLEKKYAHISSRLKFVYQSESLFNSAIRRFYDPLIAMKYIRLKAKL